MVYIRARISNNIKLFYSPDRQIQLSVKKTSAPIVVIENEEGVVIVVVIAKCVGEGNSFAASIRAPHPELDCQLWGGEVLESWQDEDLKREWAHISHTPLCMGNPLGCYNLGLIIRFLCLDYRYWLSALHPKLYTQAWHNVTAGRVCTQFPQLGC